MRQSSAVAASLGEVLFSHCTVLLLLYTVLTVGTYWYYTNDELLPTYCVLIILYSS